MDHAKGGAALMAAGAAFLAASAAPADGPDGVWLIKGRAAVQVYDCAGLLCGRIVWLKTPRNRQGLPDKDKHNPDPKLRNRPLCGLTILWNLQPSGTNQWKAGWFYDPKNGNTYRVSARLKSADRLVARIYAGSPAFGRTEKLVRIPQEQSAGSC